MWPDMTLFARANWLKYVKLVFDPCSKQLMDLLKKFRVASMS